MPKQNLKYDYAGKYSVKVIFKGGYTFEWEMDFIPMMDKYPRPHQLTVESVVRQRAEKTDHPLKIEKIVVVPKKVDKKKRPLGI